jgi:hypothetical protein
LRPTTTSRPSDKRAIANPSASPEPPTVVTTRPFEPKLGSSDPSLRYLASAKRIGVPLTQPATTVPSPVSTAARANEVPSLKVVVAMPSPSQDVSSTPAGITPACADAAAISSTTTLSGVFDAVCAQPVINSSSSAFWACSRFSA